MGTFKDTEGREWRLRMTGGLATRIREAIGVNVVLTATAEGVRTWKGYTVPTEPEKFLVVLWLYVERQARESNVTREQFLEAFADETYPAAVAAYFDSILSFSQSPALLKSIFGSGEEMVRRMGNLTPNENATNSAESSESTPASLRFAS